MKKAELSRADLLRTLACFEGREEARLWQLAAGLAFFPRSQQVQESTSPLQLPALKLAAMEQEKESGATSDFTPAPVRPPLRAQFHALLQIKEVQAEETNHQQSDLPPLRAEEYLPANSHPKPGAFKIPLLPAATLARRLQNGLSAQVPGRKFDQGQTLKLLAGGKMPRRWPRQSWPQAPANICVLVDRNQHLSPYFHDQQQTVFALARWLGLGRVATYTLQGDPLHISAAVINGKVQRGQIKLPRLAADDAALLLTDLQVLRGQSEVSAARWRRACQILGANGAPLFLCPPGQRVLPGMGNAWQLVPISAAACESRSVVAKIEAQAPAAATDVTVADDVVALVGGVEDESLATLLSLLSCAWQIEPELLRAMRKLLPALAAKPGLEGQLWACREYFDISHALCVWRPGAALVWRRKFAQLHPALQQDVLRVMRKLHADCPPDLTVQEILAWASHVAVSTREPFAEQIKAAQTWLQRLSLHPPTGSAGVSAEMACYAIQTHLAQGSDAAMVLEHEDCLLRLWAIADQYAEKNALSGLMPGALPAEKLLAARASLQGQGLKRKYQLLQEQNQFCLRLALDGKEQSHARAPVLAAIEVGDMLLLSQAETLHRIVTGEAQQIVLPVRVGQVWQLHAPGLNLEFGPVTPPFAATETGRDRYGLYADFEIMGIIQRMRYIPPGEFLMGSPETEVERYDDEGPQHLVRITQGFWLADTACTQALWLALMGDNPSYFNEKNMGGPQHPVEQVSWLDVQEFLSKLSTHLPGAVASLPTEAEWEYACRAGTISPFSVGAQINPGVVNYDGNYPYADGKKGEFRGRSVPVRSFSPNAWGLYQMHGNLWEWCADNKRKYGQETVTDPGLAQALVPSAKAQVELVRMLRGGSWGVNARRARSASRLGLAAKELYSVVGFRLSMRCSIGGCSLVLPEAVAYMRLA